MSVHNRLKSEKSEYTQMNSYLLANSHRVLPIWLPGGEFKDDRYVAKNPNRFDTHAGSFSANLQKDGLWKDFAGGDKDKGSDLVSLYAYINGISHSQALASLKEKYPEYKTNNWKSAAKQSSLKKPDCQKSDKLDGDNWQLITPIPGNAPDPKEIEQNLYWTYYDENGNALAHIIRFDKPNGSKSYCPLTYWKNPQTGERGWKPKALPTPRPLYNLDRIVGNNDDFIVVAEGEKSADAAAKLFGRTATTSLNGANGVGQTDWTPLFGRNLLIWPDNDEAGQKYADAVIAALGDKAKIKVIRFTEKHPEKWDAADALEEGWKPKYKVNYYLEKVSSSTKSEEHDFYETCGRTATELMATTLPPIEYAVEGVLPENSLGLLSAPRGVGKSWFVLQLGISLSTGKPFFVWEVPQRFRTVIIDGEMGLALLRERLEILHPGRLNNLYFVSSDDFFKAGKPMNITDMETQVGLERYFSRIGTKVVIFDNLSSLCGGVDENANQDQHAYLSWFNRLRFLGLTVIFVDHKGKDSKRQGPRGASKKEDFVHVSIELLPTSSKSQADFTISLVKCRNKRPEQENVRVRLNSNLSPARWEIIDTPASGLDDSVRFGLLQILSKPGSWTQKQLGKKLGVHQSTITRSLTKLVENGLLTKEHELTNKGVQHMKNLLG